MLDEHGISVEYSKRNDPRNASMRLLFAIPHYFDPDAGGGHGSLSNSIERRATVVANCLTNLHQQFGRPQCVIDIARRTTYPANFLTAIQVDVLVCTTGNRQLLDQLNLGPSYFQHVQTQAEPKLLGFECHRQLRERLGQYDYYCYLEDDLILHDPWCFVKLRWFSSVFGNDALLMPNRFELARDRIVHKAYVDGPLRPDVTSAFQNIEEASSLEVEALGQKFVFQRTNNPHSGCFFLNAEQMSHWASRPYFMNRDTRFVGPLESAASLGVMQACRVYKPAPSNAAFLEVEHPGSAFLSLIRLPDEPAQVSVGRHA